MFLLNLLPPYSEACPRGGVSMFLRNVGTHPRNCTTSWPRMCTCVRDPSISELLSNIRILYSLLLALNVREHGHQTFMPKCGLELQQRKCRFMYGSSSKAAPQTSLFHKHYLIFPFLDCCILVVRVLMTPENEPAFIPSPSVICRRFPGIANNVGVSIQIFYTKYLLQHGEIARGRTLKRRVSNPLPARLYYAARGYICKDCTYYKNVTVNQAVRCTTYCYFSTCGPQTKVGDPRLKLQKFSQL